MALCWLKVCICLCAPCFCLFIIMLSLTMNNSLDTPYFVAPGTLSKKGVAPFPEQFWDLFLKGDALWNRLQLVMDRHYNPILRPNKIESGFENSPFNETLLRHTFSEVISLEDKQRNFDELPQKLQDFVGNMQRRNFPTILQPDGVCGAGAKDEKEPPLLLMAIKSTELNFKNRQAIRQTWGREGWMAGQKRNSVGGYVRRVFLLGKKDTEELRDDISESLRTESIHHGDILQWGFKDTFFNLTLKDVLFWSWFSRFCNRTLFVFKGDDDVFVNTPKLVTYLQDQLRKPQAHKTMKDFMVGDVIRAAAPQRTSESKYFIPESFYKGLYPTYAGGGGVVYSGVLTQRLHNISKRVHLFPIDDVYVGMCMTRLNAQPINHPAFLTFDFPEKKQEKQRCSYHTILLVHKRSPKQIIQLWALMKKTRTQCWDVSLRNALNQ